LSIDDLEKSVPQAAMTVVCADAGMIGCAAAKLLQ